MKRPCLKRLDYRRPGGPLMGVSKALSQAPTRWDADKALSHCDQSGQANPFLSVLAPNQHPELGNQCNPYEIGLA